LTPPQPFNTLVIHMPAGISQQSRNPAITVSAILAGQFDHVRNQPILSAGPLGRIARSIDAGPVPGRYGVRIHSDVHEHD